MNIESKIEINSLLVYVECTGISGSYGLTAVIGVVEIKQNDFVELFCFCSWVVDDDVSRLQRSLRYPATQVPDKAEIRPVSEPESLIAVSFPESELGKL